MNAEPPAPGNREHEDVCLLLPWYVNGTLLDPDRRRVERHLSACTGCREDLQFESRIHARLSTDAAVEYIPAASLKRLHARLDTLRPDGTEPGALPVAPPARPWLARQGAWAASVAAVSLVLALIVVDQGRSRPPHATYHTVTSAAPPARNAVIRAVFAAQMSVGELQGILDEAQLSIVAGPSEAGVYSLASTSNRSPAEAIAQLRMHATVRFAELLQPASHPSGSP